MTEITVLKAWLLWQCRSRRQDERGEITQMVIIVSLFAAAAIAISLIIIDKFTSKAASIPTD